ncbi:M48 family metallopeptidase [Methanomicrobium antiquum]|uniref:M48 family metallopeptidase n=1 Tax=Methanomicrobium antiquum TaxID=487686 RepID=A0AAF0FPI2_9EURY|nr:SprT family zinc-dependent metalloprotease [Methanomicrobium antiquum]MDD3977697.1 SprT family zinc-dependent metalloprotease [Methanomicrobium sp.]WFN36209.1 M48 family metallopeptidase [Methanomicrobium antiquum]
MKYEGIEVEVVRKPVKNIRLSVLSSCLIRVVAPEGYDVNPLLEEKKDWILKHIEKRSDIFNKYSENSYKMLYCGQYFKLKSEDSLNRCFFDYEVMTVSYTSVSSFRTFLQKKLKDDLENRLSVISKEMGLSHGKFSIRKQKTRWASCSSQKTLNFNLRLAALPPHLRDYIIIHELSHIEEHNHSKNFWRIVERFCPKYRECKKELSEYWIMIETNQIWKAVLE